MAWPRGARAPPDARKERRSSRLALSAGPGPKQLPPSSCPRRALQTSGRRGPRHLRAGHPGIEEGAARPDPGIGALDPKKRLSLFSHLGEKFAPGEEGRRGDEPLSKVFSGTHFKSLSPPEKRRGRACRCSPGFTEMSPANAQGFSCRCLPEVLASPLPCSGEVGDASEDIVTLGSKELRATFRTVRGPRRSQLLRVWCEDQDRGCWRMRKGSPKLCKQSQFQVHSLGVGNRFTKPPLQKQTDSSGGNGGKFGLGIRVKRCFCLVWFLKLRKRGVYPTLGAGRNAKG